MSPSGYPVGPLTPASAKLAMPARLRPGALPMRRFNHILQQNGSIFEQLMPVNLSIKNAPDDLVALLKERARRNHRSMQRELLAIIDEAVRPPRHLTADEALARARRLSLSAEPLGVDIIRSDRDRR